MEVNIEQVVERMLEDSIKMAIESVIAKQAGYGLEGGIKSLIEDRARAMLDTDEELQSMIREALIYWIRQK